MNIDIYLIVAIALFILVFLFEFKFIDRRQDDRENYKGPDRRKNDE